MNISVLSVKRTGL